MEHVVPLSLGGDLKLFDAVCEPCRGLTNEQFEQSVIRNMFSHLRYRHNLPTRSPKQRPSHVNVMVGEGLRRRELSISVTDLAGWSWGLPVFNWPGLLLQSHAPEDCYPGDFTFVISKDDSEHLLALGGGREPVSIRANFYLGKDGHFSHFNRFIAKIAHAYAWAVLGEGFIPCLNKVISGEFTHSTFWIGNEPIGESQPEQTLWSLALVMIADSRRIERICVRLRLFGWMDTPVYIACVGDLKEGTFIPPNSSQSRPVKVRTRPREGR